MERFLSRQIKEMPEKPGGGLKINLHEFAMEWSILIHDIICEMLDFFMPILKLLSS